MEGPPGKALPLPGITVDGSTRFTEKGDGLRFRPPRFRDSIFAGSGPFAFSLPQFRRTHRRPPQFAVICGESSSPKINSCAEMLVAQPAPARAGPDIPIPHYHSAISGNGSATVRLLWERKPWPHRAIGAVVRPPSMISTPSAGAAASTPFDHQGLSRLARRGAFGRGTQPQAPRPSGRTNVR
jgi:hypothetical protein